MIEENKTPQRHHLSPLLFSVFWCTFSLSQFTNAYECFEKLPGCSLTLQLATYYYALQVYNEINPLAQDTRCSLYLHAPEHVIDHVIKCTCTGQEIGDDVKFLLVHLRKYHMQLSDFGQAKLLQKLGRGKFLNLLSKPH